MREIRLRASALPRWRRLPHKRQTPGFDRLFNALKARILPSWQRRKSVDSSAPGCCASGNEWVRELWRLERDRLRKNGETIGRELIFVVNSDRYLHYVGYDSDVLIWPEWFGIAFNAVKPGDKIVVEL